MPDSSRSVKSGRYQTLDHWRGLACLFVVIFHATRPAYDTALLERSMRPATIAVRSQHGSAVSAIRHGLDRAATLVIWVTNQLHLGVEVFFVISGYCIAASGQSLVLAGKPISHYVTRRFVRIFPPFWACCGLTVLACFAIDRIMPGVLEGDPWSVSVPWTFSITRWIGSLTLTGRWSGYLTGESLVMFPAQAWTLCYEEQFYAVIGLLLLISGRQFFRATTILTIVIASVVFLVSPICEVPVKGFFFDHHWFMFAAGVGVYWDLNCATPAQSKLFRIMLVIATLSLTVFNVVNGLSSFAYVERAFDRELWHVVSALLFAAILIALHKYDAAIAGMKSLKWLQWCGVMCYSIYLVHLYPGKMLSCALLNAGFKDSLSTLFICLPVCLLTSIVLGYLFHVTIERRFFHVARGGTTAPGVAKI